MVAYLWYFAYGSNLNKSQMKRHIGKWKRAYTASLKGYRLAFGYPGKGKYGFATIIKGNSIIKGAVYRLSSRQMKILDRHEEAPLFYRRSNVIVNASGKKMKAVTYIMNNTQPQKPSKSYLATIIAGMRSFGYKPGDILKLRKAAEAVKVKKRVLVYFY